MSNSLNSLGFHLDDPIQFPPLSNSLYKKQQHHTHITINRRKKHRSRHNKNNNNNLDNEENVVSRIDELGDDVLSRILLRISSWKSLARCRSVSKRWKLLITEPVFLRCLSLASFPLTLYLEGTSKNSLISEHPFFHLRNPPYQLEFFSDEDDLSLIGSYTDLFVYSRYSRHPRVPDSYILCNIITQVKVEIPVVSISYVETVGFAGILEGISSFKGEGGFRFARIIHEPYPLKSTVEIFSSETGEWSTYHDLLNFGFDSEISVTVNNKMHWLGYGGILILDPFSDDITQYRLIGLPNVRKTYKCTLGLSQKRLRLAELSHEIDNTTLKVWEIEDYDAGTWAIVNFKVITSMTFYPQLGTSPLEKSLNRFLNGVHPTTVIELYWINGIMFHPYDCDVVYLVNDKRVVRYNLISGAFKVLLDYGVSWLKIIPLVNPMVAAI